MGRYTPEHSYGHRIQLDPWGGYTISWTVDRYYRDSRQRHPRRYRRETDRAGAERFAKRWNVLMPESERRAGLAGEGAGK